MDVHAAACHFVHVAVCACTFARLRSCARTCACVPVRMEAYVHAFLPVYVYACVHVYACVRAGLCARVPSHVDINARSLAHVFVCCICVFNRCVPS